MTTRKDVFKQAYVTHKDNATQRGIAFEITFDEWKAMWCCSGKWGQRGRGSDKFCMCRFNDEGPYALGNVFIAKNKQNISEANKGKPKSAATKALMSAAQKGVPHPWVAGEKNPMHRPEVKARMRELTSGANHYKAIGVTTPSGFFATAKLAALVLGIPKATVEWRARYNKSGFSQGQKA